MQVRVVLLLQNAHRGILNEQLKLQKKSEQLKLQ